MILLVGSVTSSSVTPQQPSTSPGPALAVPAVSTMLDGAPCVVTVRACPIEQLIAGDRTTGPTGAPVRPAPILYEAVVGCGERPRGWLMVRNLSITDAQAAELLRTPWCGGARHASERVCFPPAWVK